MIWAAVAFGAMAGYAIYLLSAIRGELRMIRQFIASELSRRHPL